MTPNEREKAKGRVEADEGHGERKRVAGKEFVEPALQIGVEIPDT